MESICIIVLSYALYFLDPFFLMHVFYSYYVTMRCLCVEVVLKTKISVITFIITVTIIIKDADYKAVDKDADCKDGKD